MPRWLRLILYVLGGLFVLLVAAGLALRAVVGDANQRLAATLSSRLGVPVSIGSTHFDLAQWLRLRPAIALRQVSIGNPPGFRGAHLLEAEGMSAQVALAPLLQRRIQVSSVDVTRPRIAVETNSRGDTNVETLLRKIGSGSSGGDSSLSVSIDELAITGGQVSAPGVGLQNINLRLRDLSRETQCRFNLSATLFGRDSGFRLEGHAGPFRADSLPLDASLAATIAPQEIPAAIRRAQFGDLLEAPGSAARADLEASVRGDLYGGISGPAKLRFTDLLIGKQLPLAGTAPASFSASRLMSQPILNLKVSRANFRLGHGEWAGSGDVSLRGRALSGSSSGAIRNIDINELLSGLTSARDKIYGTLEMPAYSLQFAGADAAQIRNSLRGSGKLSITKGRLAALDLLAAIERGVSNPSQAVAYAKGATPFSAFTADLAVGQAQLQLSNIVFDGPALRFTGKGEIGFDQSMHFDIVTNVGGTLGQTLNRLTRRDQSGHADVPVVIAGTVGSPQVRPNVGKLTTGFAEGLFKSLLNRK